MPGCMNMHVWLSVQVLVQRSHALLHEYACPCRCWCSGLMLCCMNMHVCASAGAAVSCPAAWICMFVQVLVQRFYALCMNIHVCAGAGAAVSCPAAWICMCVQVLVQRSHALLHDEIVTAVYNMAAVDFKSFYGEFLRHFLQTAAGVVDCQQTTVLLAVFHGEQVSLSWYIMWALGRLCLSHCICVYVLIWTVFLDTKNCRWSRIGWPHYRTLDLNIDFQS